MKYIPKNWSDVSEEEFISHLSQMFVLEYRLGDGERHHSLIQPTMASVYWKMCEENNWLPPSQLDFLNKILAVCDSEDKDTKGFMHRVAWQTYPALVRQHHFGIGLISRLGKKHVIGGPLIDAGYGADWLITSPQDPDAKLQAIHLSVNTKWAKEHARKEYKVHVYKNHDMRLELDNGFKVGLSEQYLLHPASDFDKLMLEI